MKKYLSILCVLLCVLSGAIAVRATTTTTTSSGTYKHAAIGTTASHAVTINETSGVITTESLTTAGLAAETITVTDSFATTSSIIYCTVENLTNAQGTVVLGTVKPGSGSFVVVIQNVHATQALSGTLKLRFWFAP